MPELYDPRTLYQVRNCPESARQHIREQLYRLEEFRSAAEQVFEQWMWWCLNDNPAAAPKLTDLEALAILTCDLRGEDTRKNTAPVQLAVLAQLHRYRADSRPDGLPIDATDFQ